MLLVNASAGNSAIHGVGLIAREPIPSGTLIWKLRPGFDVVLTRNELDALSPFAKVQIRRFVYVEIDTGLCILCSDDAKYMNHTDRPNTKTIGDETWTTADVSPGEELTCNYAEFDSGSSTMDLSGSIIVQQTAPTNIRPA